MDIVARLKERDGLKLGTVFHRTTCCIHRDHRWALPLLALAQQRENGLPRPCRLVLFDRHHDAQAHMHRHVEQAIRAVRAAGCTVEDIMTLCEETIDKGDGDWVRVGMELGLISDAVVFGVEDPGVYRHQSVIVDQSGVEHNIRVSSQHLATALSDGGGALSRGLRDNDDDALCNLLQWEPGGGFSTQRQPFFLSIDLDYFTTRALHPDCHVPWPTCVWESEFEEVKRNGWCGQAFLRYLTERARVVEIAMEPEYCGGEPEADTILSKLNKYGFCDSLRLFP